jgi:hypothetical protein
MKIFIGVFLGFNLVILLGIPYLMAIGTLISGISEFIEQHFLVHEVTLALLRPVLVMNIILLHLGGLHWLTCRLENRFPEIFAKESK